MSVRRVTSSIADSSAAKSGSRLACRDAADVPWFLGAWGALACWVVWALGCAILLTRWSRRAGWGRAHRFAVAGGALLTYVWVGFEHSRGGIFGHAVVIAVCPERVDDAAVIPPRVGVRHACLLPPTARCSG